MTVPVEGSARAAPTLQELEDMYAPVLEMNGIEYRLSEKDAKAFASRLKAIMRRTESRQISLPSGGPAGAAAIRRSGGEEADPDDARAVFGPDDRYKINAQAHRQPYARIAKTWSTTSVCTAFKVYNHHTAVTAAHCVHDGPNGGWRERHQMQFAAGSSSGGGLGLAKTALPSGCYGRVVPGGWISTRERQYDYAVLYLHGRSGAWCNFADYDVGYYGYIEAQGSNISGYVSGYPDYLTSPNKQWGDLWYAARSDSYQSGNTIITTVDGTNGQSGSPFATRTDDVRSQIMGVFVASTATYNIVSRLHSGMVNFISTYAGY